MKKIFILSFLVIYFISCAKKEEENQQSELEPVSYTLYSEKLELFVEFKPLVVGETSRFAAHFTVLGEYFKSLDEGKVLVTVTDNGTVSVDGPGSPGIFRPEIKPVKAGNNYSITFEIFTKEFTDKIVIEGITVYPDLQTAINSQTVEPEGNEIPYLKEQAWKVEFANQEIKKQTFFYSIRTTGQILTPPSDEAVISAKAGGIISFNGNSYISGMPVYKGENLFSISGSALNEESINTKILEARYNYEKAREDYERASELVKDKIISEKEFNVIENSYNIARTLYNSVAKNYSPNGVRIYAPITGFLRTVNVMQGEYVETGKTLAVISRNNRLLLKADLSQKYFDIINNINSANFKTPDGKTYNTEELNGTYVLHGRNTGQDNLLLPVNFEIDFRKELIPGTFVEVYLKTTRIPDAIVIPVSALIEEQGVFYVYIQTSGEGFEKREVSITGSDGILVQVLSGIEEGERVVTKGAYQIKLASMSGTMPVHGHEH